jgi:hypothetical protein
LAADGGTKNLHLDGRRNTVYYWFDPDSGALLYHTGVNEYGADPFFSSIGEAETFLKQQAGKDDANYEEMSLYEARIKKVEDAVDVLMDQSGIDDF